MPVAERLALEKQRLNQRLGLDIAAQMGINSTDQLIKEEDLLHQHTETPNIQHVRLIIGLSLLFLAIDIVVNELYTLNS